MSNPLAARYEGSGEVTAEFAARPADTTDHLARTRRAVDSYHPKRLTLTVDEVVPETPTAVTFRLRRPGGGDLPPFLAGQYVGLFVAGTSRPYAISSSPAGLDHYDLTVRRVPGGRVSNLLLDVLGVGDTVTTTGPMGTFHHNPLFHGDDLVFLAGGSGVTPAMSMVRDIVDRGLDRRLHLLYGSRSEDDVIFQAELDDVAGRYPAIRVDHVIAEPGPARTGPTGLLTAAVVEALAGPLCGRMVYVCGPPAMYPFAQQQLAALGHPPRRARFEANGAPPRPEAQPHWPVGADPLGEVTVTAGAVSFRTPRNRPLLDALEDHGVRPEAACRSGDCSLCRVRVLEGQVHQAEEARPRMSDAAHGFVHACVSYPISDVTLAP